MLNLECLLKQSCLIIPWHHQNLYSYIYILPFFDDDNHYQVNSFWHHQNLHDSHLVPCLHLTPHLFPSCFLLTSNPHSILPSPLACSSALSVHIAYESAVSTLILYHPYYFSHSQVAEVALFCLNVLTLQTVHHLLEMAASII